MLNKLQKQSHCFDDARLEAISNKGLVRRAKKDFEQGEQPEIVSDTDICLTLKVTGEEVIITGQGFAKARCSCPSVDICRHILITGLWLRSITSVTQSDVDSTVNLLSPHYLLEQTLEHLIKWAGKRTTQAGIELFHQAEDAQIADLETITVQFPSLNVTSRFFPNSSLELSLCNCKARQVCLHQVAAVLLYQKAHDRLITLPESTHQANEAPKNRSEVLYTVKQLLTEMVAIGICHLSDAMRQRCVTLSVSATGVNLPRLSRSLRHLAEDLRLSLDRDAKSDPSRLLLTMAQIYALCSALESSPRQDLVGWHRTEYEEVGNLELAGVGAYHWQTQSGYAGITVLLWDVQARRWCSWSDSRPRFKGAGFSPHARYTQPMPWAGLQSPKQASQSHFRLMSAKRNYQGRLSSSDRTSAVVTHTVRPSDLNFEDCFQDWKALSEYAIAHQTWGLREREPLKEIVVVRPNRWGDRRFDAITQTFYWVILDSEEREILLQVPFREVDRQSIQVLEQLNPNEPKVWGIVAQIQLTKTGLHLYPISLLCESENSSVVNLSFSSSVQKFEALKSTEISSEMSTQADTSDPVPDLEEEWAENQLESAEKTSPSLALDLQINQLITELESIAEQGTQTSNKSWMKRWQLITQKFEAMGMSTIVPLLKSGLQIRRPVVILQLRYLCQLLSKASNFSL